GLAGTAADASCPRPRKLPATVPIFVERQRRDQSLLRGRGGVAFTGESASAKHFVPDLQGLYWYFSPGMGRFHAPARGSSALPHRFIAHGRRVGDFAANGGGGGAKGPCRSDDGSRESVRRGRVLQQGHRKRDSSRDRLRGLCRAAGPRRQERLESLQP